ncbi:MAG: hypothetical protein R2814_04465 [Flavobacteriaceae bacterium]
MKIKYHKILYLLIISINLQCSDFKKRNTESIIVEKAGLKAKACLTKDDKEIIIQNIFEHEDLKEYVLPLRQRDLILFLLTNDNIKDGLEIDLGGMSVGYIDSMETDKHIFDIKFKNIDCDGKKLKFTLWYDFEHADITGKANKENGEWKIAILGHGIVD